MEGPKPGRHLALKTNPKCFDQSKREEAREKKVAMHGRINKQSNRLPPLRSKSNLRFDLNLVLGCPSLWHSVLYNSAFSLNTPRPKFRFPRLVSNPKSARALLSSQIFSLRTHISRRHSCFYRTWPPVSLFGGELGQFLATLQVAAHAFYCPFLAKQPPSQTSLQLNRHCRICSHSRSNSCIRQVHILFYYRDPNISDLIASILCFCTVSGSSRDG